MIYILENIGKGSIGVGGRNIVPDDLFKLKGEDYIPLVKPDFFSFAASGLGDIVLGDGDDFHAPYDFVLNGFFVALTGAPTGSSAVFDLKKEGVSVTSTNAVIGGQKFTSFDPPTGVNPVLTGNLIFLKGTRINPSVVQVGAIEPGKSLKYYLSITKL